MYDNLRSTAVFNDLTDIVSETVDKVLSCADKYGVDRDDLMQHYSTLFSAMAEICTFKTMTLTRMSAIMENNKRLIDANALVERLEKSHEYQARSSREEMLLYRDIRIIGEQPTVKAVELPVSVGDTVWLIPYVDYANPWDVKIVECEVKMMVIRKPIGADIMDIYGVGKVGDRWQEYVFTPRMIGKSVFFTREEAEAARKEKA